MLRWPKARAKRFRPRGATATAAAEFWLPRHAQVAELEQQYGLPEVVHDVHVLLAHADAPQRARARDGQHLQRHAALHGEHLHPPLLGHVEARAARVDRDAAGQRELARPVAGCGRQFVM